MDRLFGKDGVKGIANTQLTCKVAFEIGRAVAVVSMAKSGFAPRILVGRDTRISGHMLESALVAGICSMGAQAECVGVIPSPAIAYLVKKKGAAEMPHFFIWSECRNYFLPLSKGRYVC